MERRAAKIDKVSFNFFSDTRLCIMGLVLEPRQQDSGLIRFLIELNLKSGVTSLNHLDKKMVIILKYEVAPHRLLRYFY